jgi:hypothetical protein
VLGPGAADTFADSADFQPPQIVFTSTSSTPDPAKAFTTPIATFPADPGGRFVDTIPATGLSTGVHLLTAAYLGNDDFGPSSSPVFTEVKQPDTYPQYFQPTQIAFTSPFATQDPARAFNTAGAPLSFTALSRRMLRAPSSCLILSLTVSTQSLWPSFP